MIILDQISEKSIADLALALSALNIALINTSLTGTITNWNKGAEKIFGYSEAEIIGQSAIKLIPSHSAELLALYQSSSEGKRNEPQEFLGQSRDNRSIYLSANLLPVIDSKGNVTGLVMIARDITDQQNLVKALSESEKRNNTTFEQTADFTEKQRLEAQFLRTQRMESIGTLTSGIAHNINNVLTPVLLAIQLLKSKYKDRRDQEILTTIEQATGRGADLIKQLLSYVRGLELERANVPLTELINDIVNIVKETFPKMIELQIEMAKDLWPITGDYSQLYQCLLNLCLNARDAMPNGGLLTISADNKIFDEQNSKMQVSGGIGRYVAITVTDTGSGIAPEYLEKIFEPFFTTKEVGQGTGLGLSTVTGIIKSHGGFIQVESHFGNGSQFTLYIPAEKLQSNEELGDSLIKYSGQGELILLTDDDLPVQEITRQALELYGYRVITAADGAEAVGLYVQHHDRIALVIVDMVMPIMDGRATIKALKKIDPNVKIIASSGYVNSERELLLPQQAGESQKLSQRLDIETLLIKPYSTEVLLKAVYQALKGDLLL